jgi:gamma-D-glutamyl-L-lysine dipeptidyl-peptidase
MHLIFRSAITPVFLQPTLRTEQVTQLVLGETGEVLETAGDWRRVRTDFDGYEGWVHAGYALEAPAAEAARWREAAQGWSEGATLRVGDQEVRLPLRARVALDDGTLRLPDGRFGRLTHGAVPRARENAVAARASAPERWALERFAGSPYEWGGITPWGVDCSGLVQTTFAARGVAMPRDAHRQAELGAAVDPDAIRPGDLLFFRGESGSRITHVAFAGEASTLIHSTVSCGGVVCESWLPGTRAAILRERLEVARRQEDR